VTWSSAIPSWSTASRRTGARGHASCGSSSRFLPTRAVSCAVGWRRSANHDPLEGRGSSVGDDPPRWDPHRFGSPSPRSVGGNVRGARSRPLRAGCTRGSAAASGDRACPRLGARRGHDDTGSRRGRSCDGRGQRPERGGATCRVRRWPGRGRRARRRAHELGAAAYAIKAARAAAPEGAGQAAGRLECEWQHDQLPEAIRELVLDDQRLRKDICWSVFS
jgi:hypothetical protein